MAVPDARARRRTTSFIGRSAEIEELAGSLERGAALITVVGPAGVGKTTLAREAAATLSARAGFASTPVWFVGVAGARDAKAVAVAVARALGVPLPAAKDAPALVASVAHALAGHGPAVLVLDNFEQVVAAAPASVGAWLSACPDLQVVVTSRQRLGLADEVVLALAPLSTPAADDVEGSEAVALWVARTRAQRASYRIEPEEAPLVARLVRELDGLPLAIELAAARALVLGAQGLLERLPMRLEVLDARASDAGGAGPSLRRALEASYELLDERERKIFAWSSVFVAPFSLDAVEVVLALPDGAAPGSVVEVVQSLHDKSLLRTHAGGAGEMLLSHYQTIRAFAATKLDGRDVERLRARHADYYARRADEVVASACPRGEARRRWARFRVERDDVEAAVERALEATDPEPAALSAALRIVTSLAMAGRFDAPLDVCLDRFARSFAAPRIGEVDPRTRAHALAAWARMSMRGGQLETCRVAVAAALELAGAHGMRDVEGLATELASRLAELDGRAADARELAERALEAAEASNAPLAHAVVVRSVAATQRQDGRPHEARRLLEALLVANRRHGDAAQEAWTLGHLALTLLEMGDLAGASGYAERAAALCTELDDHDGLWNATMAESGADLGAGRYLEAAARFAKAEALAHRMGDGRMAAFASAFRGLAECEAGEVVRGSAVVAEAAAELAHAGRRRYAGVLRALLGAHAANAGDIDRARALFAEADAALASMVGSALVEVMDLARACLPIAESRRAGAKGALDAAFQAARAALDRARTAGGSDGTAPLLARSAEARLAARSLERALDAAPAATPESPASRPEPLALVVHAGGEWFSWSGAERVVCSRRPVLRRILRALAVARVDSPGTPITADALLSAGWPGEKMLPSAAKNRLYVAVCRLRDLGLRDALTVNEGGYLLSPTHPLRVVD